MTTIPCRHLKPVRHADHHADTVTQAVCEMNHAAPEACCGCASYAPAVDDADRTVCEIWNRVMGYHRPITAWNAGKQQEHRDRLKFKEPR